MDPLKHAHTVRHVGIEHEHAGRLPEAAEHYVEALALYRKHESEDTLDYANAVRYVAVIKERLGKDEESAPLWEEAYDRYVGVGIVEGIVEAASWLTILNYRKGEIAKCREWFAKANVASKTSSDPATHKFIADVRKQLQENYG